MTKVLSLFSGAGGLDVGLERAGMEVVALCEIDKKARLVLRKHWPDLKIYEDVREVSRERMESDGIAAPDIVAGGSPCQDLSVAGKRAGLDGSRSGLFWEQCRIADEYKADIFWENVPGALSSNSGADFAAVLWGITGALVELPPKQKWAKSGILVGPKRTAIWRVADAQRFGVPQRRRRIYVVGCSGEMGRGLAPLLLESESSEGNRPPSGTSGSDIAGTSADSVGGSGGSGSGGGVEVAACLNSGGNSGGFRTEPGEHLVVSPFVKVIRSGARDAEGNLPPEVWREEETCPTLNAFDNGGDSRATVLALQEDRLFTMSSFAGYTEGAGTLTATDHKRPEQHIVVGSETPLGFSHTQGLDPQVSAEAFPTLRAQGGGQAIIYDPNDN